MSKNSDYIAQNLEYAKEQMARYGIPASVTLAQGILESSNGQSELSRKGNNHFGIKATSSWLSGGGEYLVYSDDKPNEKFCKYASVADSYEHHSLFLKNNSRYAACFKLAADDYKGWTAAIEKAGYATGGGYAKNLQRIIEVNGLDKYDKEVMVQLKAEGKTIGVESHPRSETANTAVVTSTAIVSSSYSFPLQREEFLFVTSPFGMRTDPKDNSKQQMHKGIDIRCKGDNVLATENGGKVVAVNHNVNTGGGKSVTIEYQREDGTKTQATYMHLSAINVKVGDVVNAGQKVGVTGNTGTRTTGEHLHFGVKTIAKDGSTRDIDPAIYLAEIAQKGNIKLQALHNGNDLLAKYKTTEAPSSEQQMTPDSWMKKLLSSEDSGLGLSGMGDPVIEMAMTLFSSLMLLAVQIDNKEDAEQTAAISEMADKRAVDLTSLVGGMKSCVLEMQENGKAVLRANNGSVEINRELSSAELSRLSAALNNTDLSDESKRMRVAGFVNGIVLSQQASQNYDAAMSESQNQAIKR